MDKEQIDAMMDKYKELLDYSNTIKGRTPVLYDWIIDTMKHAPSHCVGMAPDDPIKEYMGNTICYLRLDEDTDGIGLMMLRFRCINDGSFAGGKAVFGWETVDMTDKRNDELRRIVAKMFEVTIPDHYSADLHIVNPF